MSARVLLLPSGADTAVFAVPSRSGVGVLLNHHPPNLERSKSFWGPLEHHPSVIPMPPPHRAHKNVCRSEAPTRSCRVSPCRTRFRCGPTCRDRRSLRWRLRPSRLESRGCCSWRIGADAFLCHLSSERRARPSYPQSTRAATSSRGSSPSPRTPRSLHWSASFVPSIQLWSAGGPSWALLQRLLLHWLMPTSWLGTLNWKLAWTTQRRISPRCRLLVWSSRT